MKKYLLAGAVGLFTTAAVTATVIASNEPAKKEVKEKKEVKKKKCTKQKKSCSFFS